MPDRNYPPAYLRYFKARLSNLLRPSFWGTGIFLLVMGIVIREYWINPDFFTKVQPKEIAAEKTADTSLSQEDQAIAADIDNVPTLLSDFEQTNLSANVTTFPSNLQLKNSDFFVEDLINQKNAFTDEEKFKSNVAITNNISSPPAKNLVVNRPENLLKSDNGDYKNQFLDINNFAISPERTEITDASNLTRGLTTQTTNSQSQNTEVMSPLAAAMKKYSNTNKLSFSGSNVGVKPISPTSSLPNQGLSSGSIMGYNQLKPTNSPQNSYGNLNTIATPPNVGTSITGTSAIPNYPVPIPSPGVSNSTSPVGYGINSNVQQPNQIPPANLNYPGQLQQYPTR
ncbi:hypothetical protein [Anabaena sp. PCC 7108]|uniref:hypothetical protein n=1 Tax=Anabaena sp. PCC 7108 TaxID=163908 RepID=UPI00034CA904|nr:hypothetical protein [Anabaena sp. PCC 7108]